MAHRISKGFAENERPRVATLYWEAFAAKLHVVMGPRDKAHAFISRHLNPEFALVARDPARQVIGVAGFKTNKGALLGGELSDLAAVYGWPSALWRAPLLALVERPLADEVLLMDGICVASEARGSGLGTALLSAIKNEALVQGRTAVRLDVIDTNPRAKALYERQGFVDQGQEHIGPLRWIFGFRSATKMCWSAATTSKL